MKRVFLYFLFVSALLSGVKAQNIDILGSADSSSYVAFHVKKPFLKRGLEPWDYWTGLNVKLGSMSAGFSTGSYTDPSELDFSGTRTGWMFYLSGQYPLWKRKRAMERLSIGSIHLEPYFSYGFAYTRIGVDGPDDKSIGYGLQAFPGLLLRVSSLYIDLRPEAYLLINNPFLMAKDSRNGASGFVFMPSLAVGFDGMFDIFNPVFNSKTVNNKVQRSNLIDSKTTGYTISYDPGLGTWVHTRYTSNIYEVWEEDRYVSYNAYLSGAFLMLGPRFRIMQVRPEVGRTFMMGANAGARFGAFGIDAYYLTGEYGLRSGIPMAEIAATYPEEPGLSFRSTIRATETGASFHINPWGFAFSNSHNPFLNEVSFFRVNGKFNVSMLSFEGDPVYTSAAHAVKKEGYFLANPGIEASASNDASFLPAEALGFGWGIAVEFGAASISYDVIKYKDAPIADQQTFSLGLNIPWGKVYKKFRDRRLYIRKLRENQ